MADPFQLCLFLFFFPSLQISLLLLRNAFLRTYHLDSLNRGSNGLRGDRGSAGEPEGLVELELDFLSCWHDDYKQKRVGRRCGNVLVLRAHLAVLQRAVVLVAVCFG